jgi:hypothetical protein
VRWTRVARDAAAAIDATPLESRILMTVQFTERRASIIHYIAYFQYLASKYRTIVVFL